MSIDQYYNLKGLVLFIQKEKNKFYYLQTLHLGKKTTRMCNRMVPTYTE